MEDLGVKVNNFQGGFGIMGWVVGLEDGVWLFGPPTFWSLLLLMSTLSGTGRLEASSS